MKKSLYERLGRAGGIRAMVDDIVAVHMINPKIKARFLPYKEDPDRLIGSQIFIIVIFLIDLLFIAPSAYAQQNEGTETDITKSVKRQGTMYYMAIFFDYKEGKTDQAMNFIRTHFLQVDKKVGRKVIVFNPMTGPWDGIAFFPLPEGPGALEWKISPSDAKWNAAFVD